MNISKVCFAVIFIFFTAGNAAAGKVFSFGMGFGYLQGGLGVNCALKGDHDMKYLGTGISAVTISNSDVEDVNLRFGLGLGWVRTDMVAGESDKHGLGLFLNFDGGHDFDTMVSTGLSYTYFFKGLSQPGGTIGLAAGPGFSDDDIRMVVGVQIGYQF